MTFTDQNSCQKEEDYAMHIIGKAVYDNLIDIEHLHYEHIIFPLDAHSELIKQRMLTSRFPDSDKKKMTDCKCGKLTFSHIPEVHLDHTDDELNQMMKDIHEKGGKQYRENNR